MLDALKKSFGDNVVATATFRDEITIEIKPDAIVAVATTLRDEPQYSFEFLMDLTVVDWLGAEPRFEVVYHFFSRTHLHRLRVKARVTESDPRIASLYDVYGSSDWMEREAWEFYGVTFVGHPNLKHILLYPEFKGYPLRKDYPKAGEQPLVKLHNYRQQSEPLPPGTG